MMVSYVVMNLFLAGVGLHCYSEIVNGLLENTIPVLQEQLQALIAAHVYLLCIARSEWHSPGAISRFWDRVAQHHTFHLFTEERPSPLQSPEVRSSMHTGLKLKFAAASSDAMQEDREKRAQPADLRQVCTLFRTKPCFLVLMFPNTSQFTNCTC